MNKGSGDPHGHSFDLLFQLVPVCGILVLTIVLYMLGFLSQSFISRNWLSFLVTALIALYLAVGCILTIWKMIFPDRIPCSGCKGIGTVQGVDEKNG